MWNFLGEGYDDHYADGIINTLDKDLIIITSWEYDGVTVWERYIFDDDGNFILSDTDYKIYAPEEEYE